MNRMCFFARRNEKEILRDPLTLFFGVGFPLVLLLLMTLINNGVSKSTGGQVQIFEIVNLTPGIAVFGLSFISLFAALLISKDRCSSFVLRLFTSPLTAADFIAGYTLPLLPMAMAQMVISFLGAVLLGLDLTVNILLCIAVTVPMALMFIGLGLLCGTLLNDKAVGGICGALLTNLCAWLSGAWFDLDLVGGMFKKIAFCLPFANGVEAGRAALAGNYGEIMQYLWVVIAWAVVFLALSIFLFTKKMHGNQ